MRFKSVELENIRSYDADYRRNTVEFPEGSVLLAGDIGVGKSTLLLAIEFALFGIRRGELSGESLLRRGRRNGGVKLNLAIAGNDVTIERRLNRTAQGVRQESGYLIVDGVKREGTPLELKAWILDILGYPQELVQKQKSLLYRYTVYTPQERMKQIIRTDKETRLNVLRNVFGVDRYKTVRENISTFLTNLRAKRRELKTIYRDLENKKKENREKKRNIVKVERKLKKLKDRERRIESKFGEWERKREEIQVRFEQSIEYDKELEKNKEKHNGIVHQIEDTDKSLRRRQEAIQSLKRLRKPTEKSARDLQEEIERTRLDIENHLKNPKGMNAEVDSLIEESEKSQKELERIRDNQILLDTRIGTLEERVQQLKITGSICPICGRELDEEHKSGKLKEYSREMNEYDKERRRLEEEEKELKADIRRLEQLAKEGAEKEVEKLKMEQQHSETTLESLTEYQRQMEKKHDLETQIDEYVAKSRDLKKAQKETEERIGWLEKKLSQLGDAGEKRRKIDEKMEGLNRKLTETKTEISSEETTRENLLERVGELENEIEVMTKARDFEERLAVYEGWMEGYLVNLTATIEKHYMIEIRRQFEPLFRDWFNLLMEDEDLTVRVDEEFSPITEQQGYEAEFENLSGGEATSVALAYRLALNRVINTMIEGIQTKDVIVLDEPTDGFSETQLDKIREILDQLNTPQTIIVSHEPKIESYVDNIIHVYKEGGISKVRNRMN